MIYVPLVFRISACLTFRHNHSTAVSSLPFMELAKSLLGKRICSTVCCEKQSAGYAGSPQTSPGSLHRDHFLQEKVVPMKTVHSEVCGLSRTFFLRIDFQL